MATENINIIGVITRKLPYELANQLYHEFDNRFKEVMYLIDTYPFYYRLKRDIKTIEILLALSIFHKRVITNLDAAVNFHKTVQQNSDAKVISIGRYDLDTDEKNKLLGLLINYKKLRDHFGITPQVIEYIETKDFLNHLMHYKSSFGRGKRKY